MPARGRPRANSHDELLEAAPARHIRVGAIRAGAVVVLLASILAAVLPAVGAAVPGASGATGVPPPAASHVEFAAAIAAARGRPWAALPAAAAHEGGELVRAGRCELASSAREPRVDHPSASDGAAAGVLVLDRAIGPLSSDDAVTSAAGWALILPRAEGGPSAAERFTMSHREPS